MKKGKYEAAAPAKRRGNKSIALLLALFLLIGTVVGGTLAWLIDSSDKVTDTFTYGNVDITLYDGATGNVKWADGATDRATANKLVPGAEFAFDPYVAVEAGSEACYLFVKVEKKNVQYFDTIAVGSDWTALGGEGNDGVYYLTDAPANGTRYPIIANDKLKVLNTVTKAQLEALKNSTNDATDDPSITITAYAIQSANLTDTDADANTTVDAIDAWTLLQDQLNP